MNIFEALTAIKNSQIAVVPFTNYDAATVTDRVETGAYFKSTTNEWPINEVSYSSQGNLNLKFMIPGKLKLTETKQYDCAEIRNISIVKNGELKQQFLIVAKDKAAQARLAAAGVEVKNNVVDLSKYRLTDTTNLDMSEVAKTVVHARLKKLKTVKVPKVTAQLTVEEKILATLGLKNGLYTAPVKKTTIVESNDKIAIKLDGLSSDSTKLARKLKDLNVNVENVDLNKMMYDAKCLKLNGQLNINYRLTDDVTITGTVQM